MSVERFNIYQNCRQIGAGNKSGVTSLMLNKILAQKELDDAKVAGVDSFRKAWRSATMATSPIRYAARDRHNNCCGDRKYSYGTDKELVGGTTLFTIRSRTCLGLLQFFPRQP